MVFCFLRSAERCVHAQPESEVPPAMRREHLEHLLRAAGNLLREGEIIVVGSQSILGLCLDSHDLCTAKLVASRPKDRDFLRALLDASMIRAELLTDRLAATPCPPERRALAEAFLRSYEVHSA